MLIYRFFFNIMQLKSAIMQFNLQMCVTFGFEKKYGNISFSEAIILR